MGVSQESATEHTLRAWGGGCMGRRRVHGEVHWEGVHGEEEGAWGGALGGGG